ncbi:MAG TPA: lipoate--protein ligase [Paludibacteraceae bacterium]|nr:lipoate--protein ligase [Paludibacteraceae bacterium]
MKILFSTSTSPSFNLATEEYLFSDKSEEYLFLYVNQPSVVIGCNQAVSNEVNMGFCFQNNIQIVRRLSGGGTVYHDEGNLNFCFIHNKRSEQSSLSAGFLKPVINVLHSMNIPVEAGKRKDLWLDNFKVSGTASHISRNRELHHGTLLYSSDIHALQKTLTPNKSEVFKKAIRSVSSPVKNIFTYLTENNRIPASEADFFHEFALKLAEYFNITELSELSDENIREIEIIRQNRYSRIEWNFKI